MIGKTCITAKIKMNLGTITLSADLIFQRRNKYFRKLKNNPVIAKILKQN